MFMTNMDEVTTRNGQPSARSLSSLVRDYCRKLDEVLEDSSWSWTCASAATERMAGVSEPLFTYISQAKDSRDQPTDEEEQALASLREYLNRRDPNRRTRLNFSEYDAGTSFSAWDIHFDRTKSDVFEFGPNSSNSSMTDACGVERQAYSKEAPGKSPVINSSVNHKGTDPRPKHRITSDMCNHSEEAPSKSPIINSSVSHEGRDPCPVSKTPAVNSSVNHEGTDPCPNHHSRTNGGNKNGDSDTEDRVRARKQKRKEKHQAEKDATATKKKGRFSATDNVATEDALGVEEMESALQIARHPPKPSRSKQNQGQKTKRQRQVKSQRVRRNEAKAMAQVGGSRCVLNKDVKSYAGRNECFAKRTCLPDAVVALLPPELKQQASSLYAAMPKDRDAAPLDLRIELCRLGLSLERATPNYVKKGHAPAHLLLQERTCKLVVHVRLTDADENRISHFVAWDGSTVIDHPYNVRVNSTSDRSSPIKSQEAFDKLFKRYYKRWQITSVHRLRQRNTHEICKH